MHRCLRDMQAHAPAAKISHRHNPFAKIVLNMPILPSLCLTPGEIETMSLKEAVRLLNVAPPLT
jgi:hypothetical protein